MQSAREAEAIIRMIPDVEAVRVDLDDGTPLEVHILAAAGRHPMQIVRDVESALAAKIGKRIDRRAISIAQLRGAREQAFRLALRAVQTRLSCDTAEFQVELALDDAEFVGRASGPASRANKLKLAVEATLDAVVRSLGNRVQLYAEGVVLTTIGDMDAVVTAVVLREGGREQVLTGGAFVWRDEAESAARAALAAVNRRYELLRRSLLGAV